MRIVITGGHHNSALVIAEKLKQKGHEIIWFGHKYSMVGDKNPSAEYLEVTKKNFLFVEIRAGKWQPNSRFIKNLIKIPLGFVASFFALLKYKPDLIYSSGGYLALPVAVCGWVLKIPVATHEQTIIAGSANKLIAKFAKKTLLTYPASLNYYPAKKAKVVGMPLREEIFKGEKKYFDNNKPTIYITGGKQGAHLINEEIFNILPQLLAKFNVIHQCGSTSLFNDFKKAEELLTDSKNYIVKDYFFSEEIGSIFKEADFVVSRSGAHIVYELLALRKPAILIPIPWSSNDEQYENAKMLQNYGLAKILPQEELGKGKLLATILEFYENLPTETVLKNLPEVEKNSGDKIVVEIENILKHGR